MLVCLGWALLLVRTRWQHWPWAPHPALGTLGGCCWQCGLCSASSHSCLAQERPQGLLQLPLPVCPEWPFPSLVLFRACHSLSSLTHCCYQHRPSCLSSLSRAHGDAWRQTTADMGVGPGHLGYLDGRGLEVEVCEKPGRVLTISSLLNCSILSNLPVVPYTTST